jgi:CheY-like chemotaxis protein
MKKRLASLHTVNEQKAIPDFPKSVLLVDNNHVDNFVNQKLLEIYGIVEVRSFINHSKALAYLNETHITYQLILVDIYLPIIDGFEFIDLFFELNLHQKHGKICILSASLNPLHKQKTLEKNVRFIEKPLTIQHILHTKNN